MSKYIIFPLLLLCSLSLSNCNQLKLNPNAFYRSDFPIELNNYWVYERTDSLNLTVDTVIMTIVEKDVTRYETKNLWKLVWQTQAGASIDSSYIKFQQGNITIYEDVGVHISSRAQYNFPFKQGSEWDLESRLGTYTVKDAQFDSSIFGQDYGEAYRIERDWLLDVGDRLNEDMLMVEGIGITRRAIKRNSFRYQVYELIDYHVE